MSVEKQREKMPPMYATARAVSKCEVSCKRNTRGVMSVYLSRAAFRGPKEVGTAMALNQRIDVTGFSGSAGEVAMVQCRDRKIMDSTMIQELADELFGLVDKDKQKSILLNFA